MHLNPKVALLLLGLVLGGIAGYLTRPEAAKIKIGGASIEISNNTVSTGSGNLTSGQTQHVALYAAAGGIIGLLIGFAADGRRSTP